MKTGYTHISILLDSSGSMGLIKNDIVGGFNTFIDEQKKLDGETTITLAQFSNMYNITHNNISLKELPSLTNESFITSGMTALNDSLAKLINSTGNTLALMNEDDRPEKVLLVIITDGEENASREYSSAQVKAMIKHQEDVYNWQVAYIGANQDSFAESSSRGIKSALNFTADKKGISSMYSKLSASTLSYRSSLDSNEKFKFQ